MQNRWLSVFPLDSLYVILACCIQHVFDEDAVAGGGVINEDMSVLMMPTASYLSVSVWMIPTDHSVFLPKSAENQMNYEEIGRICCLRIRPITLA